MGQTRLEKIAAMLNEMGADAVMLTSPVNRQYAADFRSSAGICLATKQGEGYFLTDFRYIEAAGKAVEKQGYQAQMIKDNKYADAVNQLIEKHGIKTLVYEAKALSAAEFRPCRQKRPSLGASRAFSKKIPAKTKKRKALCFCFKLVYLKDKKHPTG